LLPGKMLRSRLGARLVACEDLATDPAVIRNVCAVTEMTHTASLCHDDVVDNASKRRGRPALWQSLGTSAAILIGDVLLCEAMDLLAHTGGGRHLGAFIAKVKEVVVAEAEQELVLPGRQLDEATCLRLARRKTGPLFAFVAAVCGGDDKALSAGLEEAGYHIGTAYQLSDDLLDLEGREDVAGKTLGTDSQRRIPTLAQMPAEGRRAVRDLICELCSQALSCVRAWSGVSGALRQYLISDLQPVLDRQIGARISI
jgi:geranylgeranyl pyrophosphate synthase